MVESHQRRRRGCVCAPALSAEQQCLSAPTATDKHQLKSSFPKAGNPTWPQRELHCWLTPQPRLINSCCLNSSILLGVHRCRLPLRDFPSRCGDGKRKHRQKAGKVSSERGGHSLYVTQTGFTSSTQPIKNLKRSWCVYLINSVLSFSSVTSWSA